MNQREHKGQKKNEKKKLLPSKQERKRKSQRK